MTSAATTTLSVSADSLYGLQNLPYGVYSRSEISPHPRVAVRFGDNVIDLGLLLRDEETFGQPTLNTVMAQGPTRWKSVRSNITAALKAPVPVDAVHALGDVTLHLPIEVADYVDFYAPEHHAANLGRLFRPDHPDPLTPNGKHLPVGYHGRSASIVVSGTD